MASLRDALKLQDLDEEPSVALVALITSAARDEHAKPDLEEIHRAIVQTDSGASLEPLILLPLLLPHADAAASGIIDLIERYSSAKETVLAIEEVLELLERSLQSADEVEADTTLLSPAKQLVRLLSLYSGTIPRVPKRNRLTSDRIRPHLDEFAAVIRSASHGTSSNEGSLLIQTVAISMRVIHQWINTDPALDDVERSKCIDLLYSLLRSTLQTYATSIRSNLAQRAFAKHFTRLVLPPSAEAPDAQLDDVMQEAVKTTNSLGLTTKTLASQPSISSLILLAHSPPFSLTPPELTSFIPIILSCIQSNVALDEVLSLLLESLAPLKSQSPRPELPPDLVGPLIHVLPSLASAHPDPATRHQTFRLLSLVLALTPSALRLSLLQGLLSDPELPPQMHVAAVGLVKEAVLEAFVAEGTQNVFASPVFLQCLGPILFRPNPPDLLASSALSAEEFTDTAEPLRLVECLSFFYILSRRDVRNRTGIRDADMIRNIEQNLLSPLGTKLAEWSKSGSRAGGPSEHSHEDMQLDILRMWVERTRDTIAELKSSNT